MMSITPKTWLAGTILLVGAITGCSDSEETPAEAKVVNTSVLDVPDPVLLNICTARVPAIEARDVYATVSSTFFVSAEDTPLEDPEETVKAGHLQILVDEATAAHPKHICGGLVTGIEVTFGLSGNTTRFLYRPVYYCHVAGTVSFAPTPIGPYREYTSATGFTAATDATASISSYTTELKVRENGSLRDFGSQDTRSVYLNFQVLKAVMEHNNEDGITFRNYVFRHPVDHSVRHALLVSPEGLAPVFLKNLPEKSLEALWLSGPFEGIHADRSNLCPPSCDYATFDVATPGGNNCQ